LILGIGATAAGLPRALAGEQRRDPVPHRLQTTHRVDHSDRRTRRANRPAALVSVFMVVGGLAITNITQIGNRQ
jgi:hypothetical protein